jgi:hypothetical protein
MKCAPARFEEIPWEWTGKSYYADDPEQPRLCRAAQHPHELITYGGNGAVFQKLGTIPINNEYLSEMTDDKHWPCSGHPMGLFPSHKEAPR